MSRVIAIVGSSGSGKTTIVNALIDGLSDDQSAEPACTLITVDDYYRDLSHLSFEAREAINFDHPDAIDTALLATHLDRIRTGEAIQSPCYDFTQHTRLPRAKRISPAPIVLVEGVLAAAEQAIRDRLDHVVFVDTPEDLCLERRIARDMATRARSRESVIDFWETRARPMFDRFVAPAKRDADLLISGTGNLEDNVAKIVDWLAAIG
ncbi:MAG: uridine kinase [Luminiphilus sp.]|nr:uridine kinase [Luminiphilus sp.]